MPKRKHCYAISQGKKTGIFFSWEETQEYVHGRPSRFRGFSSVSAAEAWLDQEDHLRRALKPLKTRLQHLKSGSKTPANTATIATPAAGDPSPYNNPLTITTIDPNPAPRAETWYCVVRGYKPGIYTSWIGGAQPQVDGFQNALHKSFKSLAEAQEFYRHNINNNPNSSLSEPVPVAQDNDLANIQTVVRMLGLEARPDVDACGALLRTMFISIPDLMAAIDPRHQPEEANPVVKMWTWNQYDAFYDYCRGDPLYAGLMRKLRPAFRCLLQDFAELDILSEQGLEKLMLQRCHAAGLSQDEFARIAPHIACRIIARAIPTVLPWPVRNAEEKSAVLDSQVGCVADPAASAISEASLPVYHDPSPGETKAMALAKNQSSGIVITATSTP